MLRLLRLYVFRLTFFTVSPLGSVWYEETSPACRYGFRGWFISFLFSTTRIQYTIHDLLKYAEGARCFEGPVVCLS